MDKTTMVMHRERVLPLPAMDGSKFVEALDEKGFDYRAAYWLYMSDIDDWRLYIVSPQVDTDGQRSTYMHIHEILYGLDSPLDLTLSYITVISPSEPVYNVLRKVYRVELHQRAEYVRRSMFEGTVVEEALIYRMT